MKYYKIIVKFRIAYQKLQYVKNNMTLPTLNRWVKNWCMKNEIFDEVITNTFFHLALSYVDKETCEEDILSFFKHENFSINSTFIVQNSETP